MKLATVFFALAGLSTPALGCTIKYTHTLQESFAGTNTLYYDIVLNGENVCAGEVNTEGFGASKFSDQCNDDWDIEIDTDGGDNAEGWVTVSGHWIADGASKYFANTVDLERVGNDKQFGCTDGLGLCIGNEYRRKASLDCSF